MALLKNKTKKLKASSIVESIVAMVIISLAFYIGLMVFEQMMTIYPGANKLEIKLAMDKILIDTRNLENMKNEKQKYNGFYIEKNISPYQEYKAVHQITIKAYDFKGKKIHQIDELIYSKK